MKNRDNSLSGEVKEVVQDIFTDYSIKENQAISQSNNFHRHNDTSDVALIMLLPYLAGALTGCAMARLFGGEHTMTAEYFVFGVVFAFLSGTFNNHFKKNLEWKYAFIRSIIVILPLIVIFLLLTILY